MHKVTAFIHTSSPTQWVPGAFSLGEGGQWECEAGWLVLRPENADLIAPHSTSNLVDEGLHFGLTCVMWVAVVGSDASSDVALLAFGLCTLPLLDTMVVLKEGV
jgi:hypothetical protein